MQGTDSTDNRGATKPTIPEVLGRFVAYHRDHPSWGALHIVLADGNVSTRSVHSCIDAATDDDEGRWLACVLVPMSRTQRLKLPQSVREAERREFGREVRRVNWSQRYQVAPTPPADVALAVPVYGYEVTP